MLIILIDFNFRKGKASKKMNVLAERAFFKDMYKNTAQQAFIQRGYIPEWESTGVWASKTREGKTSNAK